MGMGAASVIEDPTFRSKKLDDKKVHAAEALGSKDVGVRAKPGFTKKVKEANGLVEEGVK
ncbi:hypothetical protein B9Z19DRAFT_1121295 [Tuber borchii]|uniref:Uncharacterized protein n=1 Tax=Tuber borchii TaxID=42251 RepID=A0A2T7A2V4_TUBBO|nr:hypothetical protein B9Z19DRAFT_1121295 [Tuber borchii]